MNILDRMTLPRFYAAPMFLALCLKSGVDAFFEVNAVKYLYFFLLLFGVFFLRTGRGYASKEPTRAEGNLQIQLWLFVIVYFTFLSLLMMFANGSPQLIFKIVSPFIFFGLIVAAKDESLLFAMVIGSVLNIVANAALLPFDYGWTYWGGVRTFKGFYMFKTDLAYSLATSLLVYAAWVRFKLTPVFLVLALAVVIQVILANSRMNYLVLAIVLVFIALKNGAKPSSLLIYGVFLGLLAAIAVYMWDPKKYLGFDISNIGAFTQGRDRIVSILITYGLATYSPLELLFGRGLYADMLLYMRYVQEGTVYGAHNDYMYQLVTQGVTGLFLHVYGWYLVYKIVVSAGERRWAKGLILTTFLLYASQGMTMTVSTFALKTWPIASLLLMVYLTPDDKHDTVKAVEPKPVKKNVLSFY
jgi:O-Antigen ligase